MSTPRYFKLELTCYCLIFDINGCARIGLGLVTLRRVVGILVFLRFIEGLSAAASISVNLVNAAVQINYLGQNISS